MLPSIDDGQTTATPFGFPELERLRLLSKRILRDQLSSLSHFKHSYGFKHLEESRGVSVASSATCVLSLAATDTWKEFSTESKTKSLLEYFARRDTSADLPKWNPFTLAWILDAATTLGDIYPGAIDDSQRRRFTTKDKKLRGEIGRDSGGVSIPPYPASAYLTQLVTRVLDRRSTLTNKLREEVNKWAWAELPRQLALVRSKSKTADPLAVGYLLMLVSSLTHSSKVDPEKTSIQRDALHIFFDCQLRDGTWPLSRPLFHYPKVGSAYCYEYEMLTQLLQQKELQSLLLDYLPQLSLAAESISNTVYQVEGDIQTWTSGHHPRKAVQSPGRPPPFTTSCTLSTGLLRKGCDGSCFIT